MKKNFTFFTLATMMLLGMSSVFYACSSDDDKGNSQQEAGDKAVAELKALMYDKDRNVIFCDTETPGIYETGLQEKGDAILFVAQYLNNADYKGGNEVYQLADNRGKVTVTEGAEAGIFYQVLFEVEGIPTMTLLVEEINFMLGKENKVSSNDIYHCNICNRYFTWPKRSTPTKCGYANCNSTQFDKE